MQESRLTEIIPLICTSALWGQYPLFSHPEFPYPEFPQVHHWGWLQRLTARCAWQWAARLSPSWVPSGLTVWAAVMWWLDGCNILCLLMWQAVFYFSVVFHTTHFLSYPPAPKLLGKRKSNRPWVEFCMWLRGGQRGAIQKINEKKIEEGLGDWREWRFVWRNEWSMVSVWSPG